MTFDERLESSFLLRWLVIVATIAGLGLLVFGLGSLFVWLASISSWLAGAAIFFVFTAFCAAAQPSTSGGGW